MESPLPCNKRKKEDLTHPEWVEYQFDCRKSKRQFRDVILHTSFIEAVTIAESLKYCALGKREKKRGFRDFGHAIEILKGNISKYESELEKFEDLKDERNKLVHRIVLNGLDQNDIEEIIKKLYLLVVKVYQSDVLNSQMWDKSYYGFLPKDKFREFKSISNQNILDDSFDS